MAPIIFGFVACPEVLWSKLIMPSELVVDAEKGQRASVTSISCTGIIQMYS